MTKNQSITIELTNTQVERLEEVREDSTEGGELPPISKQQAINVLLDTYDAVNNGHYTEDYTANEGLGALVEEWKKEAQELGELGYWGQRDAIARCANELKGP